jgi:hypothetical protein
MDGPLIRSYKAGSDAADMPMFDLPATFSLNYERSLSIPKELKG